MWLPCHVGTGFASKGDRFRLERTAFSIDEETRTTMKIQVNTDTRATKHHHPTDPSLIGE